MRTVFVFFFFLSKSQKVDGKLKELRIPAIPFTGCDRLINRRCFSISWEGHLLFPEQNTFLRRIRFCSTYEKLLICPPAHLIFFLFSARSRDHFRIRVPRDCGSVGRRRRSFLLSSHEWTRGCYPKAHNKRRPRTSWPPDSGRKQREPRDPRAVFCFPGGVHPGVAQTRATTRATPAPLPVHVRCV